MKRKGFLSLFFVLALFIPLVFLASCGDASGASGGGQSETKKTEPSTSQHVHEFHLGGSTEEGHRYKCECGEFSPIEAHTFEKVDEVDRSYDECTKCRFTKNVHNHE